MDAWAENHYWGDDRDILEGWDVIFNPKYEHVPVEDPGVPEDENNTVSRERDPKKEHVKNLNEEINVEKNVQGNNVDGQRKEPKQLEIPFKYED